MSMHDEQNFEDLPDAEHVLLWAMRVWVIGHFRQQDMSARIGEALQRRGAEGALPYLEGFMWAMSQGVRRPIALLCLCRSEVSADERSLLDAFALLQQDEADEAEALLSGLLTTRAASVAIRSAEGAAQELLAAGVELQWRPAAFALAGAAAESRVLH